MKNFGLAIATFALIASAQAQEETTPVTPAPQGPCSEDLFRQFDFWVGEWNVYTTDGDKVGENSIAIEENGCLLVEHWTDIQGNTGQSYNFVDLSTQKWRQVWVSPGATIDYAGGLKETGVMELEGTIGAASSDPTPFRGTWSKQPDGSVRQHLRHFDTEKDEWSAGFVGVYIRKESTPD